LPGATEGNVVDGIGDVLRAPSAVEQDGPYTVVIGDETPFGDGQIVIRTLQTDNALLVVNAAKLVEDPLGGKVEIDRTNRHPVRDPQHLDYDEITKAVRNADQVWKQGRNRHYIKYINGRWVAVRARFAGHHYTVSTSHPIGQTKADVGDYIYRWNLQKNGKRVYGPPLNNL